MAKNNRETELTWGNPYTHEEHSRHCIGNNENMGYLVRSCVWCGQSPNRLFRYDGDSRWFCNKECYNCYWM